MQVKMVMERKPIQKPGAYELSTIGLIQATPFELMFLNEKWLIIKRKRIEEVLSSIRRICSKKEVINEIGIVVNNSDVSTVAICNNHRTLYLLSTCRNGPFHDFFNF